MTTLSSAASVRLEDPFEYDARGLGGPGADTPKASITPTGGPPPTPLLPGVHLIDYGIVQIRSGEWTATATLEAARILLETHPATPPNERTPIATTARAAHSLLAPLLRAVETALRVAMPGVPLSLRPTAGDRERTVLVPERLPAITLQPQLVLVSTLANIYLVMYPPGSDWMRVGATIDLTVTARGKVYEHPEAPREARLRHELFLRALRGVVGVRSTPPHVVLKAMMRADAVGECEPGDESEEDGSGEEEIDPEMFGG